MRTNKIAEGLYEVRSSDIYRTDIINGTCTCPSWFYCNEEPKICKHIKYLRLVEDEKKTR